MTKIELKKQIEKRFKALQQYYLFKDKANYTKNYILQQASLNYHSFELKSLLKEDLVIILKGLEKLRKELHIKWLDE